MNRFLASSLWKEITRAVEKDTSKCCAAVAYFGRGAAKLLPLTADSVLVVDMSEHAVRAGMTDPSELLKLIRRGVKVYSQPCLHAKVVVLKSRAFVGSMNASSSSAGILREAAIETTDAKTVTAARAFVTSVLTNRVGPEQAAAAAKLYRPPSFAPGGQGQRLSDTPLWLVPLEEILWDEEDYEYQKVGRVSAEKKCRSSDDFRIDEFCLMGKDFCAGVEELHSVVQIVRQSVRGPRRVYPMGTVVHKEPYTVGREQRAIIFVEIAKRRRARTVDEIEARVGDGGSVLRKVYRPRLVRNADLRARLRGVWTDRGA